MKRTLCPKENNRYRTKGGYNRNPVKNQKERRRRDEESLQMMHDYIVLSQKRSPKTISDFN
ncbi:MAG: hypothetical protein IKI57_01790 [Clostridia bacterium]|nr:hypothetical protein [Clostridia bacterium]